MLVFSVKSSNSFFLMTIHTTSSARRPRSEPARFLVWKEKFSSKLLNLVTKISFAITTVSNGERVE